MKDLIEKLETASEGSRELDWLVGEAIGLVITNKHGHLRYKPKHGDSLSLPLYTTNTDTALALAYSSSKRWDVISIEIYAEGFTAVSFESHDPFVEGTKYVKAPTLPLALCITALKARE